MDQRSRVMQVCARALLDELIEQAIPMYPIRRVSLYALDAEALKEKFGMVRLTQATLRYAVKYLRFNQCVAEFDDATGLLKVEIDIGLVALTLDQTRKLNGAQRAFMAAS